MASDIEQDLARETNYDHSSGSKKYESLADEPKSDDGFSCVERDDESFSSCQIADTSSASPKLKCDSESASYASCFSKLDVENASFVTSDSASVHMQEASSRCNGNATEMRSVIKHISLISESHVIEEAETQLKESCTTNSGVVSCKTNHRTVDDSHRQFAENTDDGKILFKISCRASVYDSVNLPQSQSGGTLLTVPNQRSMTGDTFRCTAPSRNKTGHRDRDNRNAVSCGEGDTSDVTDIDADTGLPYILVTKYSQSPISGEDAMNYRTPLSHQDGKVHFKKGRAAATPFRKTEQLSEETDSSMSVPASAPRRVSLKLPTPRLAIKFTPAGRRRNLSSEITPYVPARKTGSSQGHDVRDKSLADTVASTGTWGRFSRWSPWISTNRMQYAGLFETSFLRRLRPSVPNSDDDSVCELQEKKMELPEMTPSVSHEDCQIQRKAKTLGVACVISTYFVLGLCHTLLGQTLMDMEGKIGITLSTSAFLFTCRDTGSIIGALLVGVVFKRYRWFLSYGCALLLCALVTTIVPLASSFIQSAIVVLAQGVLLGFLDCSSNAQCLRLRGCGGLPYIDCIHVANILGCVLAPVLARPFLTAGSPDYTPHGFSDHDPVDIGSIDVTNISTNNGTTKVLPRLAHTNVTVRSDAATNSDELFRFGNAYFIAASLLLAAGIAAIALSLSMKRCDVTERSDVTRKTKLQRRQVDVSVRVACLYAVFQCVQVGVETTYGCLLVSYAVKGLGWSKGSAGILAVVYFGSCAVGRALCLTVVSKTLATISVFCGFAAVLTSLLLLLLFGRTYVNVVWLTAALQGIASTAILPACIVWIGHDVALTSQMTRVRFVASCIGMTATPGIVGYCMRAQRPDAFASMLFGACFVNMLAFAMLRGTFRRRASRPVVDRNNNVIDDERKITHVKNVS